MAQEIWKSVNGYENRYEVSSLGNVRTKNREEENSKGIIHKYKGKPRKISINPNGYSVITAGKKGQTTTLFIHVAVAKAFISNPKNKEQVNHKNGIKTDNRVENLEWVTRQENMLHAFMTGLIKPAVGENQSQTVLTEKQVRNIMSNPSVGTREFGRRYGVCHSVISAIRKGKTWNHITNLPKYIPIKFR